MVIPSKSHQSSLHKEIIMVIDTDTKLMKALDITINDLGEIMYGGTTANELKEIVKEHFNITLTDEEATGIIKSYGIAY
jgi:plasmid maintenance system antidote protein VapI